MFGKNKNGGRHKAGRAGKLASADYDRVEGRGYPAAKGDQFSALAEQIYSNHRGEQRYARFYLDHYNGNITMAEADAAVISQAAKDEAAKRDGK